MKKPSPESPTTASAGFLHLRIDALEIGCFFPKKYYYIASFRSLACIFWGVFAVNISGSVPFFSDSHPDSILVGSPPKNSRVKPPKTAESCDENPNVRSNYPTFSNTHVTHTKRKHSFHSSRSFSHLEHQR